jgi:hypothetical protein
MADASVSKTDEGNLVRVRLPLSAPARNHPASNVGGRLVVAGSYGEGMIPGTT